MKYIYYFNGVREYPWIYASLFINVESTRVIIFFFPFPSSPRTIYTVEWKTCSTFDQTRFGGRATRFVAHTVYRYTRTPRVLVFVARTI